LQPLTDAAGPAPADLAVNAPATPLAPVIPQASGPSSPPPLAIAVTQLTERIQQGLHERGFYAGAVDGIAGPATAEAIRSFEQRLGVAANGEVNDRVLTLLKSERGRMTNARPASATAPAAAAPVQTKPVLAALHAAPHPTTPLMPAPVPPEPLTGSTEGRLQRVQKALNTAGYGILRTDGRLDDKTVAAIKTYETEHGLPVTGRLTERLMSSLVVRSAAAE
jgi:peptidoglycan hydrolase-like protein with peptidoglycan-binding domain